jgi:hypothetical protein
LPAYRHIRTQPNPDGRNQVTRTKPAGTPLGDDFHVYDTTLRDGAQREGIAYSVTDKLAVARLLDSLGVGFIEGGWPGALPKDTEFFGARPRASSPSSTRRWSPSARLGAPGLKWTKILRLPRCWNPRHRW